MLKKILLILLTVNVSAMEQPMTKDKENDVHMNIVGGIILVGGIGLVTGGVAYGVAVLAPTVSSAIAPYLTIAAVKTAAAAGAAKATAAATTVHAAVVAGAPIATTIVIAVPVVREGRSYIYQTPEEKFNRLSRQEATKLSAARAEFTNCLIKNKPPTLKNSSNMPCACKEAAYMLTLAGGHPEIDKLIASHTR